MTKGKKEKVDGRSAEARAAALAKPDAIQDMYLSPNRQCTAMSQIHQRQCRNRAMVGQRTCRMHGGATKRARIKAAERVQQASGYAAELLVEFMADPTTDVQLRTKIAQDLLDRNGVIAKQIMQIGIEAPKSFEDWVGDALVEVGKEVIVDAEVVEDDDYEEPPVQNRHDRAAFAEVEREQRRAPVGLTRSPEAEAALGGYRDEQEAQVFADLEKRKRASNANKRREAFMKAIDAGATHDQAHAAGERAVNGEELPPRRRRQFVKGEFARRPSARD